MRLYARVLVTAISVMGLLVASSAPALADEGGNLVEFDSMTPVTGSAVGAVNDRGIKGGGLPWAITSGSGEVSHRGHVDVTVTGLIIPLLGRNPVGFFKVTLSCVTPHGIVNVSTGQFPASIPGGDSHIVDTIAVPHPCKDPIVFVVSPGGSWFAMSNPDGDDD